MIILVIIAAPETISEVKCVWQNVNKLKDLRSANYWFKKHCISISLFKVNAKELESYTITYTLEAKAFLLFKKSKTESAPLRAAELVGGLGLLFINKSQPPQS